jgi:import inner membrane translocase subunit TIM44
MLSARTLKQLNTVKLLTSRIQSSQIRSIHAQAALLNNQSFFGAFRDSVKRQIKENQDFNQSVKQLQDTSDGIKDSETLKRAKELFNRARVSILDYSKFI